MIQHNLFTTVAEMLTAKPPPMGLTAWGFGGYKSKPESATDVDILIVFANDAPSLLQPIWNYCAELKQRFLSLTGKELDIERLTEKEELEVGFVSVSKAVQIWAA